MRTAMGLAMLSALALGACASGGRERLVKAPSKCVDQTVSIYFEPDSAELTREARLVIAGAAQATAGCRVSAVEVVGLADAAGAPGANLELSKRRADAVAAVLASQHLPAAQFKVAAAGQAGAVTADGKAQPLRRRAEVTLRLSPA